MKAKIKGYSPGLTIYFIKSRSKASKMNKVCSHDLDWRSDRLVKPGVDNLDTIIQMKKD